MTDQREICKGIDPIPAYYDIRRDVFIFRDGEACYEWLTRDLPFTLYKGPIHAQCADRELVRKHGTLLA